MLGGRVVLCAPNGLPEIGALVQALANPASMANGRPIHARLKGAQTFFSYSAGSVVIVG